MTEDGSTRKRGDALLETIYDAATAVIAEDGYTALTFAKIARGAHTSRTVLYRRWGTMLNLVHDLLAFRTSQALGGPVPEQVRDTGSLRGDLLHVLRVYQQIYTAVGPDVVNAVLYEMSRDGQQAQAIKADIDLQNTTTIDAILGLARARGEAIKPLGPIARALPFDLVRMEYMFGRPLTDDVITEMVDDVLLPVFQADGPGRPGTPASPPRAK